MKKIHYLLLAAVGLLSTSCATTYTSISARTASMTPNTVVLNVAHSDMEYLGETTVSISAKRRAFSFSKKLKIKAIDGVKFNKKDQTTVNLCGNRTVNYSDLMPYAIASVVNKYPGADFYNPIYAKRVTKKRKVQEDWTVKVYKYNVK